VRVECRPSGFSLHHVCRSGKSGGGVGVVARNSLGYSTVDAPHGDSFESVTVRSSFPAVPLLTVVYRLPSTNANKFLTEFSDLLCMLFLYKRPILITGDFNLHVDNCRDKYAISFLDTCSTFCLQHSIKHSNNKMMPINERTSLSQLYLPPACSCTKHNHKLTLACFTCNDMRCYKCAHDCNMSFHVVLPFDSTEASK